MKLLPLNYQSIKSLLENWKKKGRKYNINAALGKFLK